MVTAKTVQHRQTGKYLTPDEQVGVDEADLLTTFEKVSMRERESTHVCQSMCVHVYVHVCTCMCICVSTCVWIHIHVYVCMCIYVCTYERERVCTCDRECAYV
jgi:hypothetical protein